MWLALWLVATPFIAYVLYAIVWNIIIVACGGCNSG